MNHNEVIHYLGEHSRHISFFVEAYFKDIMIIRAISDIDSNITLTFKVVLTDDKDYLYFTLSEVIRNIGKRTYSKEDK